MILIKIERQRKCVSRLLLVFFLQRGNYAKNQRCMIYDIDICCVGIDCCMFSKEYLDL